jgi:hypothetical protein
MKAVQTFTNETAFLTALGTGSTLINFDTDPANTPIPSNTAIDLQYLPVGVDFNPFNGGALQAIQRDDNFAFSLPNVLQTAAEGGGFEAIFTPPVSGVGLQVGDLQDLSFGNTLFEIFDASNTSLASFNLFTELGNGATKFLFFGVTSNTPIAKLQVSVGARDFVNFDDLRFSTACPESGT